MNSTSDSRPVWRKKRFWLALILLPIVAVGAVGLRAHLSLQHRISAIQAEGFPTSGAELDAYYAVQDGEKDVTDLWLNALDATTIAVSSKGVMELPSSEVVTFQKKRNGKGFRRPDSF